LARAGLQEVVLDHRDVVAVAVGVAGTPGPEVGIVGSGQGSPDPEAGIAVAEEPDHRLALRVRRMNPKRHDHHATHLRGCLGMRLWRGPFACLS
jgi:hypothetical protein